MCSVLQLTSVGLGNNPDWVVFNPTFFRVYKPEISDLCFRCGTEEGSFVHCTWQCTKVKTFWWDICDTLTKILDRPFPLDPEVCLLGNFTSISRRLRRHQIKFIEVALGVARKCISITWKSDSLLPIARWFSEMNSCVPLEKITYSLRNVPDTFLKIWQPYLDYIETVSLAD